MAILGAHQSTAGGCHRAVERAAATGCRCVQLFSKNNNQWAARPLSDADVEAFRDAMARLDVSHPLVHDSYLINLAAPDPALWERSAAALADELRRAELLGIPFVVTHPGAHTTSTPEQGLCQVVRAIDQIHAEAPRLKARILLETTAGQGTSLGWRFEQLAEILHRVKCPERLGICLDTCHVFAAGYALATAAQYRRTMKALDAIVGIAAVRAIHLNDSTKERGSRVDRHAGIGRGKMGLAPFRRLLRDERFQHVPMYLETPKGTENGEDLDRINLRVLRELE